MLYFILTRLLSKRFKNAFRLTKKMTIKPLYEKRIHADKFAAEIARMSDRLNLLSHGRFKHNEDCLVFDVSSEENIELMGDILCEIFPKVPFVIYEWKRKKYLALCPYDINGRTILEIGNEMKRNYRCDMQ